MVNLELMAYVEQQILPQYAAFDRGHNLRHVQSVIRESIALARRIAANEEMAYVVAAYHDLGLTGPRAAHHRTSGIILANDKHLRQWFTAAEIAIMRAAVEDHRASAARAPRNIYGRIVAEADRELEPEDVCRRAVEYGRDHYPALSKEEQWQRFTAHLHNKYSEEGYLHLWLPNSPNEERLRRVRALLADSVALRATFERLFDTPAL